MTETKILKIRVSLKGRPVRTYNFNQDEITIGRSPECSIYLDNPGVSREHVRITRGPGGHYQAQDLQSANGTFLNDEPLTTEFLMNDDLLRIGKFSLWFRYEEDRRGEEHENAVKPPLEGTTVLTGAELERMMKRAAQENDQEATRINEPAAAPPSTKSRLWVVATVAFALGTAFGFGTTRLLG